MDEKLKKHLKEKLNEIVFIELKKDIPLPGKSVLLKARIPMPIPVKKLADRVTRKDYEELSVMEMVEGMAYVAALDPDFKHLGYYRELLVGMDAHMDRMLAGRGIELAAENAFEEAFIYFEAALSLNRMNLDAAYNQAKTCESLASQTADKDLAQAWEELAFTRFERMTVDFDDFLLPYYHLGFHYANRNLYKKAHMAWEHFMSGSEDENKIMEVQENLLKIAFRVRFDEGTNEILGGAFKSGLEKLLPLETEYADWWNLLFFIGLAYRNLGDMENAVRYFENVVRIKPDQGDALNELGLCHSLMGNAGESARYFKKALNLDPDNPEILCNNAMARLALGDVDLADTYLRRSLELAPEDPVTLACMDELKKFKNS